MRFAPHLAPCHHACRRPLTIAATLTALLLALGPVAAAIAMRSNVDSPLSLLANGTKVDASGPIRWDADEVSGTFSITIAQGTVSGTRTAIVASGSSSWHMIVTASGGRQFHPGAAIGTGSAVVRLAGGGTETYTWTVPITLG